jgi:hypothetical protein
MAAVTFTQNLRRHVGIADTAAPGATVREVLDAVFLAHPRLRGYVLDDQGALRRHMSVFVDGQQIQDRERLSDPVRPASEIYVMQALSGG